MLILNAELFHHKNATREHGEIPLGRKPVLVLGLALFSAQFFGLAQSDQYLWIACSFIIAGLGNATFDPALSALFLELATEGYKSHIMGLRSTSSSLGRMAGPAVVVLVDPCLLHARSLRFRWYLF